MINLEKQWPKAVINSTDKSNTCVEYKYLNETKGIN